MFQLKSSLKAWPTADFRSVLKTELEKLHPDQLPLQHGLRNGSHVTDRPFNVMLISHEDQGDVILVKAGVFYASVIAGCNCADDPTPVSEQNEYCEIQLALNKLTAEASVTLLS